MPNDVNSDTYSMTFNDYSNEKSSTRFNVLEFADNTAYETAKTAFQNAVNAITNGQLAQQVDSNPILVSNQPGALGSTRELKWLCRYTDNVTQKKYTMTIPTADIGAVTMLPNSDRVNLTAGTGATFKTAFEAFVKSPLGNAVTLQDVQNVGRNI